MGGNWVLAATPSTNMDLSPSPMGEKITCWVVPQLSKGLSWKNAYSGRGPGATDSHREQHPKESHGQNTLNRGPCELTELSSEGPTRCEGTVLPVSWVVHVLVLKFSGKIGQDEFSWLSESPVFSPNNRKQTDPVMYKKYPRWSADNSGIIGSVAFPTNKASMPELRYKNGQNSGWTFSTALQSPPIALSACPAVLFWSASSLKP